MRGSRRSTKTDPNAPFYVLLRDAERKILREALEYNAQNASATATMLGISHTLVWNRAKVLGGVLPNEPRKEPFDYQTNVKMQEKTRAKRRNKHPAPEVAPDHQGEAIDAPDGAADGPHDEEARADDQPVVE